MIPVPLNDNCNNLLKIFSKLSHKRKVALLEIAKDMLTVDTMAKKHLNSEIESEYHNKKTVNL